MFFGKLKTKLRDRRGASITFALLLFLVCAVVGSVVLTAGTAAGGRLSLMTEQDQRYYSVSSALGLFRDALDGQAWTVTRTETRVDSTTTVRTVVNGAVTAQTGPNTVPDPLIPTTYAAAIDHGTGATAIGTGDRNTALLAAAVIDYVFGDETDYGSAAGFGALSGGDLPTWDMTVTPDEDGALPVRVTGEMNADGSITFRFVNAEENARDTFTLSLTLNAVLSDDSASPAVTSTVILPGEEGYVKPSSVDVTDEEGNVVGATVTTTQRTRVVTTKTTTFRWTAGEVRKVTK